MGHSAEDQQETYEQRQGDIHTPVGSSHCHGSEKGCCPEYQQGIEDIRADYVSDRDIGTALQRAGKAYYKFRA